MIHFAKITFYALMLGMMVFAMEACQNARSQNNRYASLIERKDTVGKSAEWENIKKLFGDYTAALNQDTNDIAARLDLTALYLNEARISGNQSYYYTAALNMINQLLNKENANKDDRFLALTYKSSVLLSLHQFADAQHTAEEALRLNPYNADVYGALVDAHVELGHYTQAVELCDKMMSIRPDLRSYSRASYLRQIHGDNDGAKQAMKMAVDAGPTGYEATEWARVNLGDLYLNTGAYDTARFLYESALLYRPAYPYAEMGLARLAKTQKQYDSAIVHCKKAISILSESAFVSFLAELYALKGDAEKAASINRDVIRLLEEGEKENEKETLARHNGSREMAWAYLQAGLLNEAETYAKKDLDIRPDNIDANELIAWICYLKNNFASAKNYIDKALITQVKNANTLYRASLIYRASNDNMQADAYKAQALAIHSRIDMSILQAETRSAWASK